MRSPNDARTASTYINRGASRCARSKGTDMKITVTGKQKEYDEGLTVTQLVAAEDVETPDYVTVSVNDEFVDHKDFDSHVLKDGDTVEFLYFMGGGC